jgi:HAD superfamily hydrolase (TIGR01549 family)
MNTEVEAIFLDVGNTLRILTPNEKHQSQARRRIVELLEAEENPDEFIKIMDERYKVYRKWAFANMREASESELWTRWLAPEFPPEKVAPLGSELTYQYRQSMGLRVMVEGGREVVTELYRRGYTLGLISNVITSKEIPDWLEADGLAGYFKSVVLSSVMGIRKPDPEIYYEAARRAGTEPGKCVYVGDNLQRDVTGTRNAGFGMVIIMITPEELAQECITKENRPDAIIHEFSELLQLFPNVPQVNIEKIRSVGISAKITQE